MAKRKKRAEWLQLGTIMTKDKKGSRDGGYFFIFNDDIDSVVVNGVELDLDENPFVQVAKPTDKYDYMLENNKIDEQDHEEKVEKIPKRIIFELSRPPEGA